MTIYNMFTALNGIKGESGRPGIRGNMGSMGFNGLKGNQGKYNNKTMSCNQDTNLFLFIAIYCQQLM